MKKQLMIILTTAFMLFVNAGVTGNDSADDGTRQWTAAATFNKIVINDGVNMVLTEDASQTISIAGKTKFTAAVKLEIKDGVLHISCSKGSASKRVLVYVPVQQLQRITVKGDSEITTFGILQSANIHVRIEGDCYVDIVTRGHITVDHDNKHGFDYIKKEKIELTDRVH